MSSLLTARIGRLMDALAVADFDVFIGTSPANVMYATGYITPVAQMASVHPMLVIVTPDARRLVVPVADAAPAIDSGVAPEEIVAFGRFYFESPTGAPPSTWADRYASLAEATAVALEQLGITSGRIGLDTAGLGPNEPSVRAVMPAARLVATAMVEGGTPLLAAPGLAAELGVGELLFKDETRNPTWSYKDRLAAVAITVARARGADTVAVASTGNHGAAIAAYAAAAGLRCVVLTTVSVPASMKTLMQSYGATVVALATAAERWQLLAQAVDQWGWMPMSGFIRGRAGWYRARVHRAGPARPG